MTFHEHLPDASGIVDHLDDDDLDALLGGELDEPSELRALAHLDACRYCAGRVESADDARAPDDTLVFLTPKGATGETLPESPAEGGYTLCPVEGAGPTFLIEGMNLQDLRERLAAAKDRDDEFVIRAQGKQARFRLRILKDERPRSVRIRADDALPVRDRPSAPQTAAPDVRPAFSADVNGVRWEFLVDGRARVYLRRGEAPPK